MPRAVNPIEIGDRIDNFVAMTKSAFQSCLPLSELDDRATTAVIVGGQRIVLCQYDGELFAIEDKCSHADEPLACGRIRNGWIACPAHGGRFDLATGEAVGPPATQPIETYPVRVVCGLVEVAV